VTRHSGSNDHDQAAHHWLTQHQHALTHALDDLLDTEAGLREILLRSHHDTATDNLDTVLDTEAGLAAILPVPQTSPADTHDATHHHKDTTKLRHTLSPAARLSLRNNPDVKTASQALARDRARGLDMVLDHARALAGDLAHDLAHDLNSDLNRDLNLADNLAYALAGDLASDLNRVRSLARRLAVALAGNLDPDPDRDLAIARALANELARAGDLARDLNRARPLARFLAHAHARAVDLARALALGPDLDRAYALIVEIRTAEVGRAIGLALHQEALVLDKDSPHALLDDFTATDLSTADLTGIDLSGVHWSEHTTQWPPAINVEDLKTRSDETPPGSGTWIVRSGTATIRDLAER
jgi:hypothetical protein